MLVGRLRLDELARLEVDVIVALARPIDAIGPMEAGIEPLRRIGRGDLTGEHEPHLVEIGARVLFAVEIAGFPAPIGPGAGEAVEHLLGGGLRAEALVLRQRPERGLVGDRAPQEGRNALLFNPLQTRRNASFAKIFLRQHVGRDLAPGRRRLDIVEREDDRAVRIADFTPGRREGDELVRADARLGEIPLDPHRFRPHPCGQVAITPPAPRLIPKVAARRRHARRPRARRRRLGSKPAAQNL